MSDELKTESCPHLRDPRDCEQCWRDADNATEIRSLITHADEALKQALISLGQARSAVGDLASDRVYDVEVAETVAGADALEEMERAAMSLRHVHRIVADRKRLLDEDEAAHAAWREG
jgi:hypothetical protein